MSGKGDARRPSRVSLDTFADNWRRAFRPRFTVASHGSGARRWWIQDAKRCACAVVDRRGRTVWFKTSAAAQRRADQLNRGADHA